MNNEQDLPSGLTVALIVHSVEHSLSAHLINRGRSPNRHLPTSSLTVSVDTNKPNQSTRKMSSVE